MTPRLVLFCAALAWPSASQAQLPGLPTVGLPGAAGPSLPSAPLAIPRTPDRSVLRPPLPPASMPTSGAIPRLDRNALGASPRVLDLSTGLAAEANAVLGLDGVLEEAVAIVEETAGSYGDRARELVRRHGRVLEADAEGRPVLRGEIMTVGVSAGALAQAKSAGFRVRTQERIEGLDLTAAVLAPPRGVATREALLRLRRLDPAGLYDLHHIYLESGATAAVGAGRAAGGASGRGLRVGLVDGTALRTHPTLRGAPMVQKAFAPGGAQVTPHATAVASLISGSGAGFRGAAPQASLFVADVYGTTPAGGSALAVARALGWLVQSRTPVINISLVGPPNALLEAAVAAATGRGHILVAAVGNDGPAAAPLYPAAYPGVVAVTGVDARRRVLPEAGRGPQVAFAAPGSDMLAASVDGGLAAVRGSSFAAPLVAGRLARLLPTPDRDSAARAVALLGREALDAGAPGRDPVFGRGLVALPDAVRPSAATATR